VTLTGNCGDAAVSDCLVAWLKHLLNQICPNVMFGAEKIAGITDDSVSLELKGFSGSSLDCDLFHTPNIVYSLLEKK
jgi:hypothetical protein